MKTEEHQVQGKTIAEHLIEEGMERGLERGLEAGQRAVLLRQMGRRFGELPAWAEEAVEQAGGPILEAMIDRLLEARSLEEVVGKERESAD